MKEELTHFDLDGNAVMVDVSAKEITARQAAAQGKIFMNESAFRAICEKTAAKGDVLGVARIAGIMAAKKTSDIIPLCHPLPLAKCSIDFKLCEKTRCVEANSLVKVNGRTGVEMEALQAVSTALLTIYDMCKALDRAMEISEIRLLQKSGGKSGEYVYGK
jgi:cyclic pyranopterin phosphate synthase